MFRFTQEKYLKRLESFSIFKLCIVGTGLFIAAQLKSTYNISLLFCGVSLLDGSLDSMFKRREENLEYVFFIETVVYSMAILGFGFKMMRKKV